MRRVFLSLAALALVVACADKALVEPSSRSPVIPIRIATQVTGGGRTLNLHVWYERVGGVIVPVFEQQLVVEPGDRTLSFTVDLTDCLADSAKAGSGDGCPLRLALALRDTADAPLDSIALGPFDARPGRPPTIPAIELAVQRFGVHSWAGDDALRLGGMLTPFDINTIAGYTTASGEALPVVVGGVREANSQQTGALSVLENGAWRRLGTAPGAVFNDAWALSANDIWIASNQGLMHYDGVGLNAISVVNDPLTAVSARLVSGVRLIVAGGANGVAWHGNGTTWTRNVIGASSFRDACVSSLTQAFMGTLGSSGGEIYRFNGTSWSLTPTPFAESKSGLQCPDTGTAYAHDIRSLMRWNGQAWVAQQGPYADSHRISWGATTAGELYAFSVGADDAGGTFISDPDRTFWRLGATGWSQIAQTPFTQFGAFNAIWGDPRGGRAFVASSFGRVERIEGNGVSVVSYAPAVRDVSVASASHAVAVGWNMFLARWNGTRWTVDPPPATVPRTRLVHGAWTDGSSNAWAVGVGGVLVHWNGSAWNVIAPLSTITNNAVWGRGSSAIVVGTGGQIIRCNRGAVRARRRADRWHVVQRLGVGPPECICRWHDRAHSSP